MGRNDNNRSPAVEAEKVEAEKVDVVEEVSEDVDVHKALADKLIKIKPVGCTECTKDKGYTEIPAVWKENFIGKGWEEI